MKPTALTELIQKIDSDISNALSTMPLNTPFIEYLRQHREFAISLLQKEREDMKKCLNTDATAHPHTAFVAFVDAFTGKDLADVHFDQSFTQYKTTDNE